MALTAGALGNLRTDINITPFIDVLLVLLVIFMLTVKVRQALFSQLAQERAATQAIAHPIVLELRDDGSYALNQQLVPRSALASRLQAVFQGRGESVVFLKSGGRRTYREVVQAMDIARGAGVEIIAFAP